MLQTSRMHKFVLLTFFSWCNVNEVNAIYVYMVISVSFILKEIPVLKETDKMF